MTTSENAFNALKTFKKDILTPEQLQFIAFNGDYDTVYSQMVRIAYEDRKQFCNKFVFYETITGSINKISKLKSQHKHLSVEKEKNFLIDILDFFMLECLNNSIFPRHLFQSILKVSFELIQLSDFDSATAYLNKALEIGVNKYPDLKTDVLFFLADICNQKGDFSSARNYLNQLLNHPYLITDRNRIGELLQNLSQLYLKQSNFNQYKKLLFLGLRYFYTNPANRKKIFEQIRVTYKKSWKVLLNRKISKVNRALFWIHWLYYKIPDLSIIKLGLINNLASKGLLGFIYLLNYIQNSETSKVFFNSEVESFEPLYLIKNNEEEKSPVRTQKKILITRAMGGIGDLLMMTPGIHALKRKYPKAEINLAIAKRYFPVFKGNADVKLLDIEEDFLAYTKFNKWYNFTDCPAARKESRTAPRVKKSRIEIFSSALNIRFISRLRMSKKPRFFFTNEETEFASEFWAKKGLNEKKVIGIQLHSDETYRDYPLMENLVEKLSENYMVLLFDNATISGFEFKNVIKIQHYPLRSSFSLAQKCDVIIAPDSSFIHFAAAFDIPSIAIFGPIDGKVRTKHYKNCTYLNAESTFGCIPCWRNESIPCKLTSMRTSECMKGIPVDHIVNVVNEKLCGEKIYV